MNCFNVRQYLEKMATGKISGLLFRRLQEHLQSCPGCREEYQEMKLALEMMNQEPESGRGVYFNPVWRQRIRQKAFEREANRRSFFSAFKANTLVPALGALAVLMVLGVFNLFNRFAPKAAIEPLITRYSPAVSSTIGIPLTVKFIDDQAPKKIAYHWSTDYGRFLIWDGQAAELGPEARTQADTVYWSVDFKEEFEGPSFEIRLQVEDLKTGKIIAQAKLGLRRDGEGFYVVQNK